MEMGRDDVGGGIFIEEKIEGDRFCGGVCI